MNILRLLLFMLTALLAGCASTATDGGHAVGPGPARVQVEAPLRTRPQTSAAVQQMIPAGSVLQLNVRQENDDGAWWFVGYQGRQGWVLESEVRR